MTDVAAKPTAAGRTSKVLSAEAAAKAAEVRKVVEERAIAARKAVQEGAHVAREWAADQTDVLRDTVQTRPFVSVGLSAGACFAAGLVLGVLLSRR